MRKIIGVIFAFMGMAIIFSACGSETYADKLKKEEKTISRFIDTADIRVIYTYPDKHAFKDKEYFKDPKTGVYIHVIDSGTKDKIKEGDNVYMRFYDTKPLYTYPDSLISNDKQNIDEFAAMYITFGSGNYTFTNVNAIGGISSEYYMYYYLSPGCVLPLEYNLGNEAQVSLLVPFSNGSYYQQTSYEPIFFGRLKYTFRPDQID